MVQAGMLCVCAAPLHEVRVLNPYGKPFLPDVDGLQGPCMLQLGRHIVHIKDPRKLAESTTDGVCEVVILDDI